MGIGWWIVGVGGLLWLGSRWLRTPANLPPGDDDGTLVGLVGQGYKVEAIRRYRTRHGCGLKEAKEAVVRLVEGAAPLASVDSPLRPVPGAEVEALVLAGRHLEAIKAYREAHPEVDLAGAKAQIDQLRNTLKG